MTDVQRCIDPIKDLSSDVVTHWLTFVGVHSLLGAVRHVNHEWRHAINSGLSALWQEVFLRGYTHTQERLKEIARRSHGRIESLKVNSPVSTKGLRHISSLSSLRVLRIKLINEGVPVTDAVLSSFPVLEELAFDTATTVVFPPMQHLKTVECSAYQSIKGLRNLSALTHLHTSCWDVEADYPWPASLRELAIYGHQVNSHILERIAALQQQLTSFDTDWSFAYNTAQTLFTPPFDQLSFLANFNTMQRLSHGFSRSNSPPPKVVFAYMGSMLSLREFTLSHASPTEEDLQVLSQLTNLTRLDFSRVNTLTTQNLLHICSLPNLASLGLVTCTHITDYTPVGKCSRLRELTIIHGEEEEHRLALAEVTAITQLPQLETICMMCALADPRTFSLFCNMRSLREIQWFKWRHAPPIPATALASLPSLTHLERFSVCSIKAVDRLVDYLVQMPSLRYIDLPYIQGSANIEESPYYARLRDALPRLQDLSFR